jgi:hypothetical protein
MASSRMLKIKKLLTLVVVVILALLVVAPGVASAAPAPGRGPGYGPGYYGPQPDTSYHSDYKAVCWYRVHWGDTLARIAWRYGTSFYYLAWVNHLRNPNRIYAGQYLRVPCVYN